MVLFGFGKKEDAVRPQSRTVSAVTVCEVGNGGEARPDQAFVDEGRRVYCVADGVGDGEWARVAAEVVCRNLKMLLGECAEDFEARGNAVRRAIRESNEVIISDVGANVAGATLALAVFDPADAFHVAICNVGDCRAYLVRRGMPYRVSETDVDSAVGLAAEIVPRWTDLRLKEGDRLVICSDGVHGVISEGRLAVFAAAGDPQTAADRLAADIVRHGAPDNYTFVLLAVR